MERFILESNIRVEREEQDKNTLLATVDLQGLQGPLSREARTALGESIERCGFVNLVNHAVELESLQALQERAVELFQLPAAEKLRCAAPETGFQRGYTPMGGERARDQRVGDLKEFWHIGRERPVGHPERALTGANLFPESHSDFRQLTLQLFEMLEQVALFVLRELAEYLSLSIDEQHYLSRIAEDGNSVLRVIHYPPQQDRPADGIRAAAHEDINLLTLLPTASKPGLEIFTRGGEWVPVNAPHGSLICDTGDMMALLTGGRLPATTHRVVNPPQDDGGRISSPFFLHPRPEAILRPLLGAGEARSAHDFLRERLWENGLITDGSHPH